MKTICPMLKIKSFVISALLITIRENTIKDTKGLSLFINFIYFTMIIVINYFSALDQITMNLPL